MSLRFLIDNALSPRFARSLMAANLDAIHVRAINMHAATDEAILAHALADGRIVISEDTDFGTLLARSGATRPSIVLFRTSRKSTDFLCDLLLRNLASVTDDLLRGAVVVFDDRRIRIRSLPLRSTSAG
jgi:predicted nuclease of predicted toxin-antitoxin system